MPCLHTILHPTDFSENSRHAFQAACAWARDHQATLILFHVVPPPVGSILPQPAPNPLEPAESQEALKRWRFAWPEPLDLDVRVEHRVAEGEAPQEILRLARALKCDLIIMGTHGRAGLGRLLAGSVAEEVLRKAPCPVLVVKTPGPEAAPPEDQAPARAGEVVDVRPLGAALASARTRTLLRADGVEVVRLVVRADKGIPEHKARGDMVVQCLEGRVAFTALGKTQTLEAGQLLGLPAGQSHTVQGIEDASLLVTILRPRPGGVAAE